MCLYITVYPGSDTDRAAVGRIRVPKASPEWGVERAGKPHWWLHGCELLSDDADWEAPTWDLTADAQWNLHDDLAALFGELTGELTIAAVFEPDKPDRELTMTRAAFLDLIRTNQLGNKVLYTVTP